MRASGSRTVIFPLKSSVREHTRDAREKECLFNDYSERGKMWRACLSDFRMVKNFEMGHSQGSCAQAYKQISTRWLICCVVLYSLKDRMIKICLTLPKHDYCIGKFGVRLISFVRK